MNVKQMVLENMVLQADEGLDMTEADGFTLRNIQLISRNTNPVMNIHNSRNVILDKIGYPDNAALLLNVTGEKTKSLLLSNTDLSKAKQKTQFNYGATQAVLNQKL